ncbi:MAG TPA: hypothetical protein VG943_03775 [Caulobacterales bacterium]|nr:hypothetical protein [Caulobacterales bacterium]
MGGKRILVALLCVAALAACQPKPGPDAAVRTMYAVAIAHLGKDATPLDAIPMSDDLRQQFQHAVDEAERRDEPFIDGDLVMSCQDCGQLTDLAIATKTPPASGRAVVEATFKIYGEPRVIDWAMIETPQGWRVDNITSPDGYNLRAAIHDELNQTPASCKEERGAQAAEALVVQCTEVSPATHPPCNVDNACAMIEDEIKRGCSMLSEAQRPQFCAEHPSSP